LIDNNLRFVTLREIALWLLLAVFAFLMVWSGIQLWWPVEPVRVDSVEVCPAVITRGETAYFRFYGEKLSSFPVHATIELTNGERIAIMSYTSNNPPGKVFRRRSFIVPSHTPPGTYQIKWTGVYEINPLRSVTKTVTSNYIEIK
jgi:hypothetical protein